MSDPVLTQMGPIIVSGVPTVLTDVPGTANTGATSRYYKVRVSPNAGTDGAFDLKVVNTGAVPAGESVSAYRMMGAPVKAANGGADLEDKLCVPPGYKLQHRGAATNLDATYERVDVG